MSNTQLKEESSKKESVSDILSSYFKEIKKHDLIPRDKEIQLIVRAQAGDLEARKELISAHLRFVVLIAKKYSKRGLPFEDVISEGNMGLLKAIERYDVTKGFHFISYAESWIRQSILKALQEKNPIRLPANRFKSMRAYFDFKTEIEREPQEKKNRDEQQKMFDSYGLKEEVVRDIMHSLDTPISLDYDSEDSENRKTVQFEDAKMDVWSQIEQGDLHDRLEEMLHTIPEREAQILKMRFGFDGKRCSLEEIGKKYHLSKERIRQLETQALLRLKKKRSLQYLVS